jgi:methionyl aminopeptidase
MGKVPIKSPREIELIRESSQIVAEVLALLGTRIKPGIHTKELDEIAERFIRSRGGTPAFKGYTRDNQNPFPASLCISVDDVVVHGIPNGRPLKEGEIVAIDVGVRKNGYYGDSARTFAVGRISEEKQRLMRITEESLYKGIEQAVAGNRIHDVSYAVQKYVEANGYSVVRELVGHGVGKSLHEEPAIPNYGDPGTGVKLKEGMVLAIEPMVNAGTHKVEYDADGWTVRTADRKPSAHYEHTVVVRKGEAEILTR